MSKVIYQTFDENLTENEVYNIINTMFIDYNDFANFSHYYGRLFGVLTGDRKFGDFEDFVVNECLREAIWRTLYRIQKETERRFGFNFSPRYHQEIVKWTSAKNYSLTWPGLESADVEPQWLDVAGLEAVTINPYLIEDVAVTFTPAISEYVATLDSSIVKNPNDVLFRLRENFGVVPMKQVRGYPRRDVSNNWEVVLDTNIQGFDDGDPIDVQSTKYVFVDIETPVTTGTLHPVFPNSNQKIYEAMPKESLGGGIERYWFYIWDMVNPDFYSESVDLENGEFYKLFQYISFKEFREAEFKAILYVNCKCDLYRQCFCTCSSKQYQLSTTIVDSEYSVVCFTVDGEIVDDVLEANRKFCPTNSEFYKIQVKYKTNPKLLPDRWVYLLPDFNRAIMHRTAAELPLRDCGCPVKHGFIAEQQKSVGSVKYNPVTGESTTTFKYGDLVGQKVYGEITNKSPIYKVTVV